MVDRLLTSNIDVRLAWDVDDPNEGISHQSDEGDIQPEYTFATGTGIGQCNSAWYSEFIVSGNNAFVVDLQDLPVGILGMPTSRSFSNIKSITIENTSPSSYLIVGTSGVSEPVRFLGYTSEIGYSGIVEATSQVGYTVDSTKHNLSVTNPSNIDIKCKILIQGVEV